MPASDDDRSSPGPGVPDPRRFELLAPVRPPELAALVHPRALGLAIARRRVAMGLSVEDAAQLCDVGPRFLRELETGKLTSQLGRTMVVVRRLGLELLLCTREDLPMVAERAGLAHTRDASAEPRPTKARRSRIPSTSKAAGNPGGKPGVGTGAGPERTTGEGA